MKVANSQGIINLVLNASGRNRSVYEDEFIQAVDPDGTHVLLMQFPHNDVEVRTKWACKMKGTLRPADIWLDVDYEVLNRSSSEIEAPSESG